MNASAIPQGQPLGLDSGSAADEDQYLTFMLNGEEYGVDILRVQEIKGWDTVTPLPNTPNFIKGVMNLRGTIVPIVCLRERFGMEPPKRGVTHFNRHPLNPQLLEKSFAALSSKAADLVHSFYCRLMDNYPETSGFFADTDLKNQERKLLAALKLVVANARKPDDLAKALRSLGQKHESYGIEPQHYEAVAKTFLEVLREYAGDLWQAELEEAWSNALQTIAATMLEGYRKAEIDQTVVIVLRVEGEDRSRIVGIVADAVSDVYNVAADNISAAPDFGDKVDVGFVEGMATIGEKMVILLDIDKLLSIHEAQK